MTNQEINEAVARRLGWTYQDSTVFKRYQIPKLNPPMKWFPPFGKKGKPIPTPKGYCRSIEAAWEICEELRRRNLTVVIKRWGDRNDWLVDVLNEISANEDMQIMTLADTAPMAICMAFLKLPDLAQSVKGVEN